VFSPIFPPTANFTPEGLEPLRSFTIEIEYHPRSQDRLAGYTVYFTNLATGESLMTQTALSSAQAVDVATVLHHALWLAD
jgi:hypothetical protein